MEQSVYVDVLFMIDLSMDFLCVFITAKILQKKLSLLRAVLASALGALYSVAVLFVEFKPVLAVTLDVALCSLICLIALGEKRQGLKHHLRNILVYICVCAIMGGLMSAAFNLLSKYAASDQVQQPEKDGLGPVMFSILAILSAIAVGITGRTFRRNVNKRKCTVTVTFCGYRAEFHGINDSGNLLRDTLSGKCVIPISKQIASSIFSQGTSDIFDLPSAISSIDKLQPHYAAKIRFIPSTTATGKGIMIALVPDKVVIQTEKGHSHTVDALVAPVDIGVDGIEALVPDELMN